MGLRGTAKTLEIVVVDKSHDIGETERRSHQDGLPRRSFLYLPVAEDRVYDCTRLARSLGERHSDYHRQAMPERACRCFDPRIAVVGVATKAAVRLAIKIEVFPGEHAEILENDVLDHAAVPLRHDERVRR